MTSTPQSFDTSCTKYLDDPRSNLNLLADDLLNEIYQYLSPLEETNLGQVDKRLHKVFCDVRLPAAQQALVEKLNLNDFLWPRSVEQRPFEVLHRRNNAFMSCMKAHSYFHLVNCQFSPDGDYIMAVSAKPNYENRAYDAFIEAFGHDATSCKSTTIPGGYHITASPDSNHLIVLKPGAVLLLTRDKLSNAPCLDQLDGAWKIAGQVSQAISAQYTTAAHHGIRFSADSQHAGVYADNKFTLFSRNPETGNWFHDITECQSRDGKPKTLLFSPNSKTCACLADTGITLFAPPSDLPTRQNANRWHQIHHESIIDAHDINFSQDGSSLLITTGNGALIMQKTDDVWEQCLSVANRGPITQAAFTSDDQHCFILSKNRCDLISRDSLNTPWSIKFTHSGTQLNDAMMLPCGNKMLIVSQREINTPFAIIKENAKLSLWVRNKNEQGGMGWRQSTSLSQQEPSLGEDDGQSIYSVSADGRHIARRTHQTLRLFSHIDSENAWKLVGSYATQGTISTAFFTPGGKHLCITESCIANNVTAPMAPGHAHHKITLFSAPIYSDINENAASEPSQQWQATLTYEGSGLYVRPLSDDQNLIIVGSLPVGTVQVWEAKISTSTPDENKRIFWEKSASFTATDLFNQGDRPWRFALSPDKNDILVTGLKKEVSVISR